MAWARIGICDFGWKARDFKLKGVDGKTYTLADVRGSKGTLVVFISNHCPYVKASIDRIVTEAKVLREIGVGTIAIMPNDTATYREDSFDNMKAFAAKHGFTFPYVIDETQEVARAYDASPRAWRPLRIRRGGSLPNASRPTNLLQHLRLPLVCRSAIDAIMRRGFALPACSRRTVQEPSFRRPRFSRAGSTQSSGVSISAPPMLTRRMRRSVCAVWGCKFQHRTDRNGAALPSILRSSQSQRREPSTTSCAHRTAKVLTR